MERLRVARQTIQWPLELGHLEAEQAGRDETHARRRGEARAQWHCPDHGLPAGAPAAHDGQDSLLRPLGRQHERRPAAQVVQRQAEPHAVRRAGKQHDRVGRHEGGERVDLAQRPGVLAVERDRLGGLPLAPADGEAERHGEEPAGPAAAARSVREPAEPCPADGIIAGGEAPPGCAASVASWRLGLPGGQTPASQAALATLP